ncbi:MAG: T9SS type A sorting domain-containing protein [Chitinophagales bacterium]
MKRLQLFILMVALTSINLSAQTVFLKSYGDENPNYFPSHVTDNDGNSYFGGYFLYPTFEIGEFTLTSDFSTTPFIYKVDPDGNVIWAFSEPSAANPTLYDIALDNDNNFIICGEFSGTDAVFSGITLSSTQGSAYIAKYNSDGEIIWAKNLPGESLGYSLLSIDDENNIIVGGYTTGDLTFLGNEVEVFGDYDVIYGKYDANGNELWMESMGSPGSESLSSIATDHDGNIFLSVRYYQSFTFQDVYVENSGLGDGLLTKTNPNGEAQWIKTFTGEGDGAGPRSMVADENNDLYVNVELNAGELYDANGFDNYGYTDVYLMKIHGDDGELSWSKFGGGGNYDHPAEIALGTDGIFITGTYQGAAEFDGLQLYTEFQSGFIVAYQRDGSIAQVYDINGNDFVTPQGLDVDAHGNLYCSGTFAENAIVSDAPEVTTVGGADIFLYKLGSVLVPVNNIPKPEINIELFPNPSAEKITLTIPELSVENISISILNTEGQNVFTENNLNLSNEKTIDLHTLPAGSYTMIIISGHNIVSSKKFVRL